MRLVTAVAALLLVGCGATGAFAHASLVATEPRDGSMVAQAPKTVRLRFNEPVTPAVIRVIDSEGRTRNDAAVHAADETIEITLPTGLPAGTQVISYRVISADGHPVAGSMMFSVGMGKSATVPASSDATLAILIWLSRIGLYLGLFVGVGGVFFDAWTADARTRSKPVVAALMLGLVSAVVSLGCQGLDLLGLPIGGHPDPRALASRDRDHARAVARHCRRGDGSWLPCPAIALGKGGANAVGRGDGGRWAVACGQRSRQHGAAAMVDPAGGISARNRPCLVGRSAAAVDGPGAASGATAAAGIAPVFEASRCRSWASWR